MVGAHHRDVQDSSENFSGHNILARDIIYFNKDMKHDHIIWVAEVGNEKVGEI